MNEDAAQTIALLALSFLAEDDDRLGRFMGWTGLDSDQMRGAPTDLAMLGGVLDYFEIQAWRSSPRSWLSSWAWMRSVPKRQSVG